MARRLAHEIKNPLTPIQLSAERLQFKLADKLSNGDADMLARGTQTIINQVQAMKRMVDDFRDYARMPAPEVAELDLNELIGEVLGLYESSSATIESRLAADLPPILGDATQLRQIIHNLLRNAEDALEGRDGTRILIQTEMAGRQARMTIADNGPGFPVELLPRIFEPYVTTKARGTGLGLPIVKKNRRRTPRYHRNKQCTRRRRADRYSPAPRESGGSQKWQSFWSLTTKSAYANCCPKS